MKYLAITAILCIILAGASFAGNVTMTEVITGGNLTLTMPSAFSISSVTIGGATYQYGQGLATYTIEDSRGTGAGWNVSVQISQFTTGGTPNRTIAATGKFAMTAEDENIACVYGQAKDGTNGPKAAMGGGTYINTETEAIHALEGYGMGKYTSQMNHILMINADRYAGTYTATLTATLNAVP